MAKKTRFEVRNPRSLACWALSRNVARTMVLLLLSTAGVGAYAGKPVVEYVEMEKGAGGWTVSVTVRHGDTGWDHYADAWRIVGPDNMVIGTRTLYHPHETEQPFTRNLSGVVIPPAVTMIEIQAHDKVHGWGSGVRVDIAREEGAEFRIRRSN